MKNIKILMIFTLFSLRAFPYVDPFASAKFHARFNEEQRRSKERSDQELKRISRMTEEQKDSQALLVALLVALPVDCVTACINFCCGSNIGYLTPSVLYPFSKEAFELNQKKKAAKEVVQNTIKDTKSFLEQADKLTNSPEDLERYTQLLQELNQKQQVHVASMKSFSTKN